MLRPSSLDFIQNCSFPLLLSSRAKLADRRRVNKCYLSLFPIIMMILSNLMMASKIIYHFSIQPSEGQSCLLLVTKVLMIRIINSDNCKSCNVFVLNIYVSSFHQDHYRNEKENLSVMFSPVFL